eukprot:TRINITY_DN22926_c0_g1_i1.p1 TRINITY_DN22926_c0_g1~~TRINITY_DN22926_c0_g1_i1.p1  ORF type:complete len:136 (+),score=22.76 TRINITY_DN22926_c0_g1_i1:85-492(+)
MALFGDDDDGIGEALRDQGISDHVDNKFMELSTFQGVRGVIILNSSGDPVKWYFEENYQHAAFKFISISVQLMSHIRTSLRKLDKLEPDSWGDAGGEQDLRFLRVRSKKNEIIIAPSVDYTLVVVQDLNAMDMVD